MHIEPFARQVIHLPPFLPCNEKRRGRASVAGVQVGDSATVACKS